MASSNLRKNTATSFIEDHNMLPEKKVRAYRQDLETFPEKWRNRFPKEPFKKGADGSHFDYFETVLTDAELREFEVDIGAKMTMRQYWRDDRIVATWHPIYKEVEV